MANRTIVPFGPQHPVLPEPSAVYMAESLDFYRLKDLPVKQHHKVKLRHKISVISKLTKHIMFKTAGTVNVPKTLPYKVFDFIVFFFFL